LETGQKWGATGTPPFNPSDPRWVNVLTEVKHQRDCYQNDREGIVTAIVDNIAGLPTSQILLSQTDRYWDSAISAYDYDAIDYDENREIFIDGIAYRIQQIASDPNSLAFDPLALGPTMQWIITLDRTFEGVGNNNSNPNGPVTLKEYAHAIGAEYVGAPFRWQEPTNLVWLGDGKDARGNPSKCLPNYPVVC
jgi:hypothetical protein